MASHQMMTREMKRFPRKTAFSYPENKMGFAGNVATGDRVRGDTRFNRKEDSSTTHNSVS